MLRSAVSVVRISLNGRVAVTLEGADHELRGRHTRVVLALLATERHRSVTRDELAEALWGDALPDSWQSSLRMAVSKVRAFLASAGVGAGVIMSSSGGYRLTLGGVVHVDIESARHSVEAAERALTAGDLAAAASAAAAARGVLSDPFVPGGEGPWVDRRRDEAKRLLVRAVEAEAEACAGVGRTAAAVAAAEEAIALEPFRESAHRTLMRAQAAAGNRAEALRGYERCRRLLREELGVDPSPAMETLYLELLRGEPLLPAATGAPALRAAEAVLEESDALQSGRAAAARGAWHEAFELLSLADSQEPLAPEDLEALAEAALWVGHHAASASARRRAHASSSTPATREPPHARRWR